MAQVAFKIKTKHRIWLDPIRILQSFVNMCWKGRGATVL